jgi:hypothetical protein
MILTLTLVAFPLAACGVSTKSATAIKPRLASIDSALLKQCRNAVQIPDKALTQADVERYWGSDRASLVECRRRHKGLGEAIKFRDNALQE